MVDKHAVPLFSDLFALRKKLLPHLSEHCSPRALVPLPSKSLSLDSSSTITNSCASSFDSSSASGDWRDVLGWSMRRLGCVGRRGWTGDTDMRLRGEDEYVRGLLMSSREGLRGRATANMASKSEQFELLLLRLRFSVVALSVFVA